MQVSATQLAMMAVCLHPELQDPVEGTPLPCQTIRSNVEFCGIKGLKWKENDKVQDAEVTAERKVIELVQ
jgi:hypothetical protein